MSASSARRPGWPCAAARGGAVRRHSRWPVAAVPCGAPCGGLVRRHRASSGGAPAQNRYRPVALLPLGAVRGRPWGSLQNRRSLVTLLPQIARNPCAYLGYPPPGWWAGGGLPSAACAGRPAKPKSCSGQDRPTGAATWAGAASVGSAPRRDGWSPQPSAAPRRSCRSVGRPPARPRSSAVEVRSARRA